MSKSEEAPVVACFGEILWDCLPRGLFLGGAPMNVAYHLSRLGGSPLMISAVGRDFLGDEARRRMAGWGFDLSFVARLRNATGVVHASLDLAGVARYIFDPRPAWDCITAAAVLRRCTVPPVAVVFGTLALRGKTNRQTLTKLLAAWPETLRVADLNLRAPFDRADVISWTLERATLLKLNTEELARLVRVDHATPAGWARAAERLARLHGIKRICVTAGPNGAGLLWDGTWFWSEPHPVIVRDTIGAGDAFLAGLLAGVLLRHESPLEALTNACRLGEFVASQDGATPVYRCDARGQPVRALS